MKVGDLQQHLADLGKMLSAAGAKGNTISDLKEIVDGLAPFRAYELKDFASFLIRAEGFSRGEVPVKPGRAAPKPRAPKAPKEPTPDPEPLALEAHRLYQQAASPTVTVEHVDSLVARLNRLSKGGLLIVAEAVELRLAKNATMPKIVAAIQKKIIDRKGSFVRAGLIDRQGVGHSSHSTAPDAVDLEPLAASSFR